MVALVMRRREALKVGVVAAAAATSGLAAPETSPQAAGVDIPRGLEGLRSVAEAALPGSLGADGLNEALTSFLGWIRDHDAGRDLEHGYGHTRIAKSGPAPTAQYQAQLRGLDAAARREHGKVFAALEVGARRALITEAFAALKIDGMGERPSGSHVAADLMSHYFSSNEANDLCYEAGIGRDSCRALEGSGERPEPLAKGPAR